MPKLQAQKVQDAKVLDRDGKPTGATYTLDGEAVVIRIPLAEMRPTSTGKAVIIAECNSALQPVALKSPDGSALGTVRLSAYMYLHPEVPTADMAERKRLAKLARLEAQVKALRG